MKAKKDQEQNSGPQKNINFLDPEYGPDQDRASGLVLLAEACDMFKIKIEDIARANIYMRKQVVIIITNDGWKMRYKKKTVPHPLADVKKRTLISVNEETFDGSDTLPEAELIEEGEFIDPAEGLRCAHKDLSTKLAEKKKREKAAVGGKSKDASNDKSNESPKGGETDGTKKG